MAYHTDSLPDRPEHLHGDPLTTIRYYSEQKFTPMFVDVLKGAKQYAFGDAEVRFQQVEEPGPGVLCFGAGLSGFLVPSSRVLTMSADGLSLLVRGLKLAAGVITPPPPHKARVIESTAELDGLGKNIVVDIETRGDIDGPRANLELLSIGIWDGTERPVYIVPDHLCHDERLIETLAERSIIAHNSAFDIAVLNALWGTSLRPHADTMVLHYAMHPASKSHGLKDLVRYYLGVDDWDHDLGQYLGKKKDYGNIPKDVLYRYNALDVYYTGHLLVALTEEATEDSKRFYEQRMKDNNLLIEIEEGPGVFIDVPYFERLYDNMQADLDALRTKMAGIVGRPDFNPASPAQVQKYLVGEGFEVESTQAKVLEQFEGEPFIDALLEYKKTLKTRGFVKSFLEKNIDGYLRPQFKIARTTTGRLASANPNIQQIPREGPIKRGIIPPPGYKIVTADYSQVELRIMAVLSGDKEMQAQFQPGSGDFFDALIPAAFPDLFPTPEAYKEYKAGGSDKKYRAAVKGVTYGLSYGRGAAAIGEAIGQDREYAQGIINNIFTAYPQWGQWRERVKGQAVRGELTAWTGMPFEAEIVHWRNRAELERSGLSFMPQHHANQLLLNGTRKVHENLNGRGWVHAVVHDAAYLYVKEEHAEDVARELEAALVEAGREFFGDAVVFAAEPEIMDTWEEE